MKRLIMPIIKCLLMIFSIILLTQCIPIKEIKYLQNVNPSAFKPLDGITDKYFLQTNDYLSIQISSIDPKLSDFFNQNSSTSSNTLGTNANMFYYLIDDSLNVDFPYAGNINLKGCNLRMAKKKIREALNPFLKEAIINVKLASCHFTILGEVRSGGSHTMEKDQITIFEAIGMAGDLTTYGKRKDIKLVRHYPTETKTYSIDLTDEKIVDSEFYYIYPNDLIYVRPMNAKMLGLGETLNLSIIGTAIALYFTIYALVKN